MYDRAKCFGYQQITLSTTAASSLTIPGTPKYSNAALLRVENGAMRFRMDGTAPTTGSGMPLYSTDTAPFWIDGLGLLQNLQAIAVTGTPVLDVMYFGSGM
jgi:hypothetical protein